MKIAIMGSGGVGAYVGARLQDVGAEVHYIARGAHLQALQTDGLRIEMPGKDLYLPKVSATEPFNGTEMSPPTVAHNSPRSAPKVLPQRMALTW